MACCADKLEKLRGLDVAWYGAAAAAAGAGAALFPSNRIGAGVVLAGAVLAIGVWRGGRTGATAAAADAGRAASEVTTAAVNEPTSGEWATSLLRGAGVPDASLTRAGGCCS